MSNEDISGQEVAGEEMEGEAVEGEEMEGEAVEGEEMEGEAVEGEEMEGEAVEGEEMEGEAVEGEEMEGEAVEGEEMEGEAVEGEEMEGEAVEGEEMEGEAVEGEEVQEPTAEGMTEMSASKELSAPEEAVRVDHTAADACETSSVGVESVHSEEAREDVANQGGSGAAFDSEGVSVAGLSDPVSTSMVEDWFSGAMGHLDAFGEMTGGEGPMDDRPFLSDKLEDWHPPTSEEAKAQDPIAGKLKQGLSNVMERVKVWPCCACVASHFHMPKVEAIVSPGHVCSWR